MKLIINIMVVRLTMDYTIYVQLNLDMRRVTLA